MDTDVTIARIKRVWDGAKEDILSATDKELMWIIERRIDSRVTWHNKPNPIPPGMRK